MKNKSLFASVIFIIILATGLGIDYSMHGISTSVESTIVAIMALIIASYISSSIKIADPWDKAVVLRLGKFHSLKGPGLFFIIPVLDTIPYWIDTRVITTSFKAEKTLTKDTVPVDVDAVLFWKVLDPQKAALEVADYIGAISWASQTALRDVIGKTMLSEMLEGRDKISSVLQKLSTNAPSPGESM
jgi:regulator of protease activity HflC (stomatin/prohibitin superfamily)